jgi:hypothetical protein
MALLTTFVPISRNIGHLELMLPWTNVSLVSVQASEQFPPTQQVVLELISRMPNEGKHHCVWLDNLFTSEPLLLFLREREVGGAGTVRMGATRAEKKLGEDPPDLPGNPQQAAVSDGGALSNPIPLLSKEKDSRAADFFTNNASSNSFEESSFNCPEFYQFRIK